MSEGYFRIGKIVPSKDGGFHVEVLIKWHRHKTKPHTWGYNTTDGDELQAYREAVEWCLGKRRRPREGGDGVKFDEGQLVQHDWRK
jgi:hypothetical protein